MWVEEHGKYRVVKVGADLASSNAAYIVDGNILYRQLLPGTEIITSSTLPRREWFDFDRGKVEASLLLVGKDDTLPGCLITARLYVDRLLIAKQVIDPSDWESDIVQQIPLGDAILTHDEIMIVRVERELQSGKDMIGVLACSFIVEGVRDD